MTDQLEDEIGTISQEIARACADISQHPKTPEAALERFALRLQTAWGKKPLDPIAEIAKHFPPDANADTLNLLEAISAAAIAVQSAGRMLDKALWGLLLLACVCVAQLLALAILR
jgi:hypothetical protein